MENKVVTRERPTTISLSRKGYLISVSVQVSTILGTNGTRGTAVAHIAQIYLSYRDGDSRLFLVIARRAIMPRAHLGIVSIGFS